MSDEGRPRFPIVTTHVERTKHMLELYDSELEYHKQRLSELKQYQAQKRWVISFCDIYENALGKMVSDWISAMAAQGYAVTDFDYSISPQESLRRHRLQIIGCYVSLGRMNKAIEEVNHMESLIDIWKIE